MLSGGAAVSHAGAGLEATGAALAAAAGADALGVAVSLAAAEASGPGAGVLATSLLALGADIGAELGAVALCCTASCPMGRMGKPFMPSSGGEGSDGELGEGEPTSAAKAPHAPPIAMAM